MAGELECTIKALCWLQIYKHWLIVWVFSEKIYQLPVKINEFQEYNSPQIKSRYNTGSFKILIYLPGRYLF